MKSSDGRKNSMARPRSEIVEFWEQHVEMIAQGYAAETCIASSLSRPCPGRLTLTEFRERATEYGFESEKVRISGQDSNASNFRSDDEPFEFPFEIPVEDVQIMTRRELAALRKENAKEAVRPRTRAERASQGSVIDAGNEVEEHSHYVPQPLLDHLRALQEYKVSSQKMIMELYQKVDVLYGKVYAIEDSVLD